MMNTSDSALTGFLAGRADNNNGYNNGMGWGMEGWWFIIVLFALWNNGFGGWGNGFGGNNFAGSQFTDSALQRGFDTQTIIGKLDGINQGLCDGFYAMNTGMLNGFANVGNAICNLGYEQAQLSNATNVAIMQGNNALATQLSDCCCRTQTAIGSVENAITGLGCSLGREIERGFANTNYNMATQACAIQTQLANSTRDIIDSQQAGTRAVLDYLCQEKISDLQQENQTLRLAASQSKQNEYLINTLRPCPSPAYITCNPFTGGYGYGAYGYNNNGCNCCNNGCCGCNN